MKRHILKLAAPLVVLLFLVSFVSPVLAANNGAVNTQLETQTLAPVVTIPSPDLPLVNAVPGGYAPVSVTFNVNSPNGNGDLKQVDAVITNPSDNLQVTATATSTSGSVTDAKDTSFTLTLQVPYYFDHTDNGGPVQTISVTATNNEGLVSPPVTATFFYQSALGITVSPGSIDYGNLQYGQASTANANSVTIQNIANTPVTLSAATPNWQSDAAGSAIPAGSLTMGSYTMSNAGTPIGGLSYLSGSNSVTMPTQVTIPSNTPDFTMIGTYSTTTTITASA